MADRTPAQRLLLLELMPNEPERQFRVAAYPWLMGLARAMGWKASWAAVGVRYDPALVYRLPAPELDLLRVELRRTRPTIALINERLAPGQWEALAALVPERRLAYWPVDERFEDLAPALRKVLPEVPEDLLDEARLFERLPLDFRRKTLGRAPWVKDPLIRVILGSVCEYRTRVSAHPLYRGLPLRYPAMGCSFCSDHPLQRPAVDAAAFAARAVAAACRQRPAAAERRFELRCQGLWRRLEEFVRLLIRRKARRAELTFSPRIDEILATRTGLRRCLPLLKRSGLAVRIYGMGVENFSPAENRRLNKGITAAQVHEAVRFIAETSAAWPGVFRCERGRLSMILFTPWTTVEDLRVNVENIARCALIEPNVLGQRLQLFQDRPITRLAERDGLTVERGGSFYNSGCISRADQHEVPWRFKHPETALLWQLAQRLVAAGRGEPPRHGLDREAAALLEAHGPGAPPDPLPAFARAVALMRGRGRPRSLEALLKRLRPSQYGKI